LFPNIQNNDGKTTTLRVEPDFVNNAWVAESVCTKRFVKMVGSGAYVPTLNAWIARLNLTMATGLDPKAERLLARTAKAAAKVERGGGFLYVTGDITGNVRTNRVSLDDPDQGPFEVTAIRNLQSTPQPPPGKLPVVSLCALFKDLTAYDAKRVAVRGQLITTMEGAWITPTEQCDQRFVTKGFAWGFDLVAGGSTRLNLPEPGLTGPPRWERQVVSGVFVGIVILPSEYAVRCRFGQLRGYGFGHLSGSPAVFFGETVINPELRETFSSNRSPEPVVCTADPQ
jgi:hypothetical protein